MATGKSAISKCGALPSSEGARKMSRTHLNRPWSSWPRSAAGTVSRSALRSRIGLSRTAW
jgi:hypothetical protein